MNPVQFIPVPPQEPTPIEEQIAHVMVSQMNDELNHRMVVHCEGYRIFWKSPCTPDSILASLGSSAQMVIASAGENVDHIKRLAAIVGKKLSDFLPDEYWVPKRAFIPGPNGTMTLAAPADGHDAWGNPVQ